MSYILTACMARASCIYVCLAGLGANVSCAKAAEPTVNRGNGNVHGLDQNYTTPMRRWAFLCKWQPSSMLRIGKVGPGCMAARLLSITAAIADHERPPTQLPPVQRMQRLLHSRAALLTVGLYRQHCLQAVYKSVSHSSGN